MRTKTLLAICGLFALIFLNLSDLPWWPNSWLGSVVIRVAANLFVLPLLLLVLVKGNVRLRQWRRRRSRDLDEEEQHETEAGHIRLGLQATAPDNQQK